jgi:hypothetical protein
MAGKLRNLWVYGMLIFSSPLCSAMVFSLDDLEGTWYVHELGGGADPWWAHFTMQVDNTGAFTASAFLNNAGETEPPPSGELSLSNSGVVSAGASGVSQLHATMSADKNLIVATATEEQGPALIILQRAGEAFTLDDLAGTWREHELGGGADPWWAHFTMQVDNTGAFTASAFLNNAGETEPAPSGELSLSNSGVVSTGASDVSQLHATMSADKNLIVATATEEQGPALIIMQSGSASPDTDGDGVNDDEEISSGRNPNINEPAVLLILNNVDE